MIYEVNLSSGDITEYETLESLLSMLNEDNSIDNSVFFQSVYSAQHKQKAIRKGEQMMFYFWQILVIILAFVFGFIARGYFRIEVRKKK